MVKYPSPIQRGIAPVLQLFYNRQGGFLWLKMDCGSLYKTKRKPLYYLIFQAIQGFSLLAEKERFELSRRYYRPTPLAGAPLRPLEYFSVYSSPAAGCIGLRHPTLYTILSSLSSPFLIFFASFSVFPKNPSLLFFPSVALLSIFEDSYNGDGMAVLAVCLGFSFCVYFFRFLRY